MVVAVDKMHSWESENKLQRARTNVYGHRKLLARVSFGRMNERRRWAG